MGGREGLVIASERKIECASLAVEGFGGMDSGGTIAFLDAQLEFGALPGCEIHEASEGEFHCGVHGMVVFNISVGLIVIAFPPDAPIVDIDEISSGGEGIEVDWIGAFGFAFCGAFRIARKSIERRANGRMEIGVKPCGGRFRGFDFRESRGGIGAAIRDSNEKNQE